MKVSNRNLLLQGSIFRGKLLVSGRVKKLFSNINGIIKSPSLLPETLAFLGFRWHLGVKLSTPKTRETPNPMDGNPKQTPCKTQKKKIFPRKKPTKTTKKPSQNHQNHPSNPNRPFGSSTPRLAKSSLRIGKTPQPRRSYIPPRRNSPRWRNKSHHLLEQWRCKLALFGTVLNVGRVFLGKDMFWPISFCSRFLG